MPIIGAKQPKEVLMKIFRHSAFIAAAALLGFTGALLAGAYSDDSDDIPFTSPDHAAPGNTAPDNSSGQTPSTNQNDTGKQKPRTYVDDSRKRKPASAYIHEPDQARVKVREAAQKMIGFKGRNIFRNGKKYPNDCSGMVRSIYDAVGIDVFEKAYSAPPGSNGVAIIYHAYKNRSWNDVNRKPRTGDLILFNNTYDKNRNRKWDDRLTHVAIVTGIEENGTIVMIHHVNSGIRRYRMSFEKRNVSIQNGVRYNNALRVRPRKDPNRAKYLTSNLFYRYIDIIGDSPQGRSQNKSSKYKAKTL